MCGVKGVVKYGCECIYIICVVLIRNYWLLSRVLGVVLRRWDFVKKVLVFWVGGDYVSWNVNKVIVLGLRLMKFNYTYKDKMCLNNVFLANMHVLKCKK